MVHINTHKNKKNCNKELTHIQGIQAQLHSKRGSANQANTKLDLNLSPIIIAKFKGWQLLHSFKFTGLGIKCERGQAAGDILCQGKKQFLRPTSVQSQTFHADQIDPQTVSWWEPSFITS